LLKDFLFNGEARHDYWYPLKNLKEISFDRRYWFGIISDAQAVREINKITMSKKESFPFIVYCPAYHNEEGNWRILFKYPRDPRFYALNTSINHRLEFSRLYSAKQLQDFYPKIIKDELDRIENAYCHRKWGIPDEEEMKISFHTPGALTYLREAKVAYVYTDETPKEMMKRVKKEARDTAKKEQEEKRQKKIDKGIQKELDEKRKAEEKEVKRLKKEQEKLGQKDSTVVVEEHEGDYDKEVKPETSLINMED